MIITKRHLSSRTLFMDELFSRLPQDPQLTILQIERTFLSQIIHHLSHYRHLHTLILDNNKIGGEYTRGFFNKFSCVQDIAVSLIHYINLEYLGLHNTGLDGMDAYWLLTILYGLPKVQLGYENNPLLEKDDFFLKHDLIHFAQTSRAKAELFSGKKINDDNNTLVSKINNISKLIGGTYSSLEKNSAIENMSDSLQSIHHNLRMIGLELHDVMIEIIACCKQYTSSNYTEFSFRKHFIKTDQYPNNYFQFLCTNTETVNTELDAFIAALGNSSHNEPLYQLFEKLGKSWDSFIDETKKGHNFSADPIDRAWLLTVKEAIEWSRIMAKRLSFKSFDLLMSTPADTAKEIDPQGSQALIINQLFSENFRILHPAFYAEIAKSHGLSNNTIKQYTSQFLFWQAQCIHFIDCKKNMNWFNFSITETLLSIAQHKLVCFYDPMEGQETARFFISGGHYFFQAYGDKIHLTFDSPVKTDCVFNNPEGQLIIKADFESRSALTIVINSEQAEYRDNTMMIQEKLTLSASGYLKLGRNSKILANDIVVNTNSLCLNGKISAENSMECTIKESLETGPDHDIYAKKKIQIMTGSANDIRGSFEAGSSLLFISNTSLYVRGNAKLKAGRHRMNAEPTDSAKQTIPDVYIQANLLLCSGSSYLGAQNDAHVVVQEKCVIDPKSTWNAKKIALITDRFENHSNKISAEVFFLRCPNTFINYRTGKIYTTHGLYIQGGSAWNAGTLISSDSIISIELNYEYVSGIANPSFSEIKAAATNFWEYVTSKGHANLAARDISIVAGVIVTAFSISTARSIHEQAFNLSGFGLTVSNNINRSAIANTALSINVPNFALFIQEISTFFSPNSHYNQNQDVVVESTRIDKFLYCYSAILKILSAIRWSAKIVFPMAGKPIDFIFSIASIPLTLCQLVKEVIIIRGKLKKGEELQAYDLYKILAVSGNLLQQGMSTGGQFEPGMFDIKLTLPTTPPDYVAALSSAAALIAPAYASTAIINGSADVTLMPCQSKNYVVSVNANLSCAINNSTYAYAGCNIGGTVALNHSVTSDFFKQSGFSVCHNNFANVQHLSDHTLQWAHNYFVQTKTYKPAGVLHARSVYIDVNSINVSDLLTNKNDFKNFHIQDALVVNTKSAAKLSNETVDLKYAVSLNANGVQIDHVNMHSTGNVAIIDKTGDLQVNHSHITSDKKNMLIALQGSILAYLSECKGQETYGYAKKDLVNTGSLFSGTQFQYLYAEGTLEGKPVEITQPGPYGDTMKTWIPAQFLGGINGQYLHGNTVILDGVEGAAIGDNHIDGTHGIFFLSRHHQYISYVKKWKCYFNKSKTTEIKYQILHSSLVSAHGKNVLTSSQGEILSDSGQFIAQQGNFGTAQDRITLTGQTPYTTVTKGTSYCGGVAHASTRTIQPNNKPTIILSQGDNQFTSLNDSISSLNTLVLGSGLFELTAKHGIKLSQPKLTTSLYQESWAIGIKVGGGDSINPVQPVLSNANALSDASGLVGKSAAIWNLSVTMLNAVNTLNQVMQSGSIASLFSLPVVQVNITHTTAITTQQYLPNNTGIYHQDMKMTAGDNVSVLNALPVQITHDAEIHAQHLILSGASLDANTIVDTQTYSAGLTLALKPVASASMSQFSSQATTHAMLLFSVQGKTTLDVKTLAMEDTQLHTGELLGKVDSITQTSNVNTSSYHYREITVNSNGNVSPYVSAGHNSTVSGTTGIFVRQSIDNRFVVQHVNGAKQSADRHSITCLNLTPESIKSYGIGFTGNVGSVFHPENSQIRPDINMTISLANSTGSTFSLVLPSPLQVYDALVQAKSYVNGLTHVSDTDTSHFEPVLAQDIEAYIAAELDQAMLEILNQDIGFVAASGLNDVTHPHQTGHLVKPLASNSDILPNTNNSTNTNPFYDGLEIRDTIKLATKLAIKQSIKLANRYVPGLERYVNTVKTVNNTFDHAQAAIAHDIVPEIAIRCAAVGTSVQTLTKYVGQAAATAAAAAATAATDGAAAPVVFASRVLMFSAIDKGSKALGNYSEALCQKKIGNPKGPMLG